MTKTKELQKINELTDLSELAAIREKKIESLLIEKGDINLINAFANYKKSVFNVINAAFALSE